MDLQHPAILAIHDIRALSLLFENNPEIVKQNGVEFYGEQNNMITIENLLTVSQKNSDKEISIEELKAFMPTLCRLCRLKFDGWFITLL